MRFLRPIGLAAASCLAFSPAVRAQVPAAMRDSIVKVTSTIRAPDWTAPWRLADAEEYVGTGMVVAKGRVLTCAHLVQHASRICVQPDRSAKKVLARIASFSESLDMALLEPVEEALAAPALAIRGVRA